MAVYQTGNNSCTQPYITLIDTFYLFISTLYHSRSSFHASRSLADNNTETVLSRDTHSEDANVDSSVTEDIVEDCKRSMMS